MALRPREARSELVVLKAKASEKCNYAPSWLQLLHGLPRAGSSVFSCHISGDVALVAGTCSDICARVIEWLLARVVRMRGGVCVTMTTYDSRDAGAMPALCTRH